MGRMAGIVKGARIVRQGEGTGQPLRIGRQGEIDQWTRIVPPAGTVREVVALEIEEEGVASGPDKWWRR